MGDQVKWPCQQGFGGRERARKDGEREGEIPDIPAEELITRLRSFGKVLNSSSSSESRRRLGRRRRP